MIQPKYSPQEAMDRIKLMMKYDTSKTLNENKEMIYEQQIGAKTAISTGAAAATGAAVAGGAAAAGAGGALGAGAYSALGLGASLGVTSATAAAALGGAVFAGAAALAVTPLVIWWMDKDNAKPKVQRMIQYCTSDATKIAKVPRGISDKEVRDLSDSLYDAMEGLGTDEDKVYNAFKSIKTASDFCALVNRFAKDYGDLLEWLDDDFDQSSEWEQIFRPLRDAVEDTLMDIKDDTVEDKCKTNPDDPACKKEIKKGGGGGGGGYTPCSGTYKYGCKADAIKKAQACLGLTADGKWGPKTDKKLKDKGFTTFTDSDIDKICEKAEEKLTNDVEIAKLTQDQGDVITPANSTAQGQGSDPNTKTGIS